MAVAFPSGCILVPVPVAIADPEPFTPDALATVKAGVTTRAEVRDLFSHWRVETDDGPQVLEILPQGEAAAAAWIFKARRQMGSVGYVGLVVYGFVVAPVWGGFEDNYQDYSVLVEFNDDDTVRALWLVNETGPCKPGEACYRDSRIVVTANAAITADARSRGPSAGGCSLLVYADESLQAPAPVADGVGAKHTLWRDSFVRIDQPPGTAAVDRNAAQLTGESPAIIDLGGYCMAGETRYVALSVADGRFSATQVPAQQGAQAVGSRFLVDHEHHFSLPVDIEEVPAVTAQKETCAPKGGTEKSSMTLEPGASKANVLAVMGAPWDCSVNEQNQAWQYMAGAGVGQCDYHTFWFQGEVLHSIASRRGPSIAGCLLGSQPVDWGQFKPSPIDIKMEIKQDPSLE